MSNEPGPTDLAEVQLAKSQHQFAANAAKYTTSTPHAKGKSLKRLPELVAPKAHWKGLDIATGGGHCALEFAGHIDSVIASDATPEMLDAARGLADDRGITNVSFELADAHDLPFEDDTFDLVTCRIAPHHFSDPALFVREATRVLRSGGTFALVDNIAPESPDAAKWCDDFERRRDPSHLRCLPLSEWRYLADQAGLAERHVETLVKPMNFAGWADNMSVPVETRRELLNDLRHAPSECAAWLQPELDANGSEADSNFVFIEGLLVADKRQE